MNEQTGWKDELIEIFQSYFHDESLDDALYQMVAVGSGAQTEHERFMTAFNEAIKAADAGDPDIYRIVKEGNFYDVDDYASAVKMLQTIARRYREDVEEDRARPDHPWHQRRP